MNQYTSMSPEELAPPAALQVQPTTPLIKPQRFAELVGVTDRVVEGWIQNGYLPVVKIGRHSLVNLALVHQSFRLDLQKGKLIDPYWQKLNEDCLFFDTEQKMDYKRIRKTPGQGSEKNIALALGNLISLYACQRFSQRYALICLERSGIWEEITAYYRRRGVELEELKQLILEKIVQRRILGKAA